MSGDYLADSPEHEFTPQDRLPDRCGFISDGMTCGYDRKCHEALWPREPSASAPDDLADFLAARYDEAETRERRMLEMLAKAGPDACLAVCFDDGTSSNAVDYNPWDVITDYDPKHRLADITLKRAILAEHPHQRTDHNWTGRHDLDGPFGCATCHIGISGDVYEGGWCATVRQLGTEFAEHAAYRAEWRPE